MTGTVALALPEPADRVEGRDRSRRRTRSKQKKQDKKRAKQSKKGKREGEQEVSEKHRLLDAAAIVGIGATEFSKDSGRSELRLAVEACEAAIADAGLTPSQIDGMVTFTAETNPEIEVAKNLGCGELSFFSRIHHGGGAACGTIQQAVLAVNAGVADYVVCYRAFNERSGRPLRRGRAGPPAQATAESAHFAWYAPFGLLTPAQWVAMFARRYMHEYGATSEDFGRIAVADRKHAATNPKACFYEQADHARGPPGSRAGSSSRCTCSTAARRATAPRRSWSRRPSGRATCRTRRCIVRASAQGRATTRR